MKKWGLSGLAFVAWLTAVCLSNSAFSFVDDETMQPNRGGPADRAADSGERRLHSKCNLFPQFREPPFRVVIERFQCPAR